MEGNSGVQQSRYHHVLYLKNRNLAKITESNQCSIFVILYFVHSMGGKRRKLSGGSVAVSSQPSRPEQPEMLAMLSQMITSQFEGLKKSILDDVDAKVSSMQPPAVPEPKVVGKPPKPPRREEQKRDSRATQKRTPTPSGTSGTSSSGSGSSSSSTSRSVTPAHDDGDSDWDAVEQERNRQAKRFVVHSNHFVGVPFRLYHFCDKFSKIMQQYHHTNDKLAPQKCTNITHRDCHCSALERLEKSLSDEAETKKRKRKPRGLVTIRVTLKDYKYLVERFVIH